MGITKEAQGSIDSLKSHLSQKIENCEIDASHRMVRFFEEFGWTLYTTVGETEALKKMRAFVDRGPESALYVLHKIYDPGEGRSTSDLFNRRFAFLDYDHLRKAIENAIEVPGLIDENDELLGRWFLNPMTVDAGGIEE
jgi:hypothetical protein